MKKQWECIGLMALLILVSGCSGYCVSCTSLQDNSPDRNNEFTSGCDLAPGDEVRVILVNKEMVAGVIDSVSPTEIALKDPSGDSAALAAALYVGVSNWSMY